MNLWYLLLYVAVLSFPFALMKLWEWWYFRSARKPIEAAQAVGNEGDWILHEFTAALIILLWLVGLIGPLLGWF